MLSKQKIRVSRLFEILHGIDTCSNVTGSFGFSYGLGRSKKIIMDQALEIEKMNKPSESFNAFQLERQQLIEVLAQKIGDQVEYADLPDHSGKAPVFKDPAGAEILLANLAEKHTAAIESRKQQNREYIKFHQEESVEVELYLIKKDHLPEDKLTPAMVYAIFELIEEI